MPVCAAPWRVCRSHNSTLNRKDCYQISSELPSLSYKFWFLFQLPASSQSSMFQPLQYQFKRAIPSMRRGYCINYRFTNRYLCDTLLVCKKSLRWIQLPRIDFTVVQIAAAIYKYRSILIQKIEVILNGRLSFTLLKSNLFNGCWYNDPISRLYFRIIV